MFIDNQIIEDLEDGRFASKPADQWFDALRPKYQFSQYIPPQIAAYFKHLMDEDVDFKMKSTTERKKFYIEYLKKYAGLHFLASGTNRMCFTSEWDPNVIVKLAYNSGRKNAENEMFIQDKLKPHVSKTFDMTPDGIFSLHERVIEIGSKEDLLPFAEQHFMIMMDFYERGFIIEDVGTKTFRNLGVRPEHGLVLLDYPTVYQIRPGDLKCSCGGRIFYDAGFNRLQCHTCGKVFTAASLSSGAARNYSELQQSQNVTTTTNEYLGGVKMKFKLNITVDGTTETRNFDTRKYQDRPVPQVSEPKPEIQNDLEGIQFKGLKAKLVFDDNTAFKLKNAKPKKDNRNNKDKKKFEKPEPAPVKDATIEEPKTEEQVNTTAPDEEELIADVQDPMAELLKDDDLVAEINAEIAAEEKAKEEETKEVDSNDGFIGHQQLIEAERTEETTEEVGQEEKSPKPVRKSRSRSAKKDNEGEPTKSTRRKKVEHIEDGDVDDGVETSSKYPAKKKSTRTKKGDK